MSKTDTLRIPDYLGHIVEAIERIHRYVEDMFEVGLLDDERTQDAVVRNFEIIGEATRNIERYPRPMLNPIPKCLGRSCTPCVTGLLTAISRWISSGICPNCVNR